MQGSASLKAVLPAFVPGMSYDALDISHGGEAQQAYFRMLSIKDKKELAKLRKGMLDYCRQDTLAMVRLHEKLIRLSSVRSKTNKFSIF